MDKFFAALGRVFFLVVLAAILVGGGYLLASKFRPGAVSPKGANQVVTMSSPLTSMTNKPVVKTPVFKTITAGLPKSAKLSYYQYKITFPDNWSVSNQGDLAIPTERLVLSKNGHQLSIYQAATGGADCVYPGDSTPEGPAGMYGSYVEFAGNDKITYRRGMVDSTNISTQNFGVCARVQNISFGEPTPFGHILYQTPKAFDQDILAEMDGIVASLTRVL